MIDCVDKALQIMKEIECKADFKLMFIITNSPPHGKEFGNYGDNYGKGCPCNKKWDPYYKAVKDMKIKLILLKVVNNSINDTLMETETEFRKYLPTQFISQTLNKLEKRCQARRY